jgi:MYCBP-associated protein family
MSSRQSDSKFTRVAMQSATASINTSDVNFVTWKQVSDAKQAEVAAERCVDEVLKRVESFVSGEFHQKSSCTLFALATEKTNEEKFEEDQRLVNWKRWIKIREKQSDKIRKFTLRRRPEMLLNCNPNDYRMMLTRKQIIEKAVLGFGATNFWKVPEQSRKDLHLTLPKSERVEKQEIVYTQTPDLILKEQRIYRTKSPTEASKLVQEKLDKEIKILQPSMAHLALKGNVVGDGLERPKRHSRKDSIQLSLKIEKCMQKERLQVLKISGVKIDSKFSDVNVHVDLKFEGLKKERKTKKLRLENHGMIAIDLKFYKKSPDNLSDTRSFFFSKSSCRIIPGEILEIPISFYPTVIGVHVEEWILNCNPLFSKECYICVSLFGHCLKKRRNDGELKVIATSIEAKTVKVNVERSIKQNSGTSFESVLNNSSEENFRKMMIISKKTLLKDVRPEDSLIQNTPDNTELQEKYEMVRNVFDISLETFHDNISEESDQIKIKLHEAIDQMINILES